MILIGAIWGKVTKNWWNNERFVKNNDFWSQLCMILARVNMVFSSCKHGV
jgi:hypothetical protein